MNTNRTALNHFISVEKAIAKYGNKLLTKLKIFAGKVIIGPPLDIDGNVVRNVSVDEHGQYWIEH